jgi:hypothetical protein
MRERAVFEEVVGNVRDSNLAQRNLEIKMQSRCLAMAVPLALLRLQYSGFQQDRNSDAHKNYK